MKREKGSAPGQLAQVATELHRLADTIGSGKVQVSGVDLSLSDSVTLKLKQKITGKKVVFDLKIQAMLVTDDRGARRRPMKGKKSPRAVLKKRARPFGVKALKKKYTAVWRVIASQIKKGETPDPVAVSDLQTLSVEYGESAPESWGALWQESEALVNRCIDAAQAGDFSTARRGLDDIAGAKKSCHKRFK